MVCHECGGSDTNCCLPEKYIPGAIPVAIFTAGDKRKETHMVKHIVLWNFAEGLSEEEKTEAGEKMKSLLEPIKKLVPGAVEIQVIRNRFSSSNRDIALVSTFETQDALMNYQNCPAHVEAGKYVRSVTCNRACLDYEFDC